VARGGLLAVLTLVGVALFADGWSSHYHETTTSTPSSTVTQSITVPSPAATRGPSAQEIAEQQTTTLSGQALTDQQNVAKAYVASMAGDPTSTVCLTSQDTVGLVISVDRPAGSPAATNDERQSACSAHLKGSHLAGAGDPQAATPTFDHWAQGGRSRAMIVFVDGTGVDWPVGTTTKRYNLASGVDSRWKFSCPAGSGYHCVIVAQYQDVTAPDQVCVGAYSCTFRYAGSDGHWVSAWVTVNDSSVSGAAQHRKVVCHALGHALGLEHDSSASSCMNQDFTSADSLWPSEQNLSALHAKYAHDDG
jgi:Matrixin